MPEEDGHKCAAEDNIPASVTNLRKYFYSLEKWLEIYFFSSADDSRVQNS